MLFLNEFFKLFDAKIDSVTFDHNEVYGILSWEDDIEKQHFYWQIEIGLECLPILTDLCKFIRINKLNDNDRITISKEALKSRFSNILTKKENIEKCFKEFFNLNIQMMDEGQPTDMFFLHF